MRNVRQEDRLPSAELRFARKNWVERDPTMLQLSALMATVSLLTFAALVLLFELFK